MAQNIGNGLERMTLLEHPGGKGMTKDMGALVGDVDSCGPDATINDGGKRAGAGKRVIRGSRGQKHLMIRAGGAGMLQVIQKALSYLRG